MRDLRLAACVWFLAVCGGNALFGAEAKAPSPTSVFDEFAATPTAAGALALIRQAAGEPSKLQRALALPEPRPALIAWALYHYPDPAVRTDLEELLWSADQVAGYWAAKALGRVGSPASIAALERQFPEEDTGFWEISSGAPNARSKMYYFRYIQTKDRGQVRQSTKAPTDMPNIRVAYAALEALGCIGGEDAANILLRECRRKHYLMRQGAAKALGQMRYGPARELMAALTRHDPVLIVRAAAKEALARIEGRDQPASAGEPDLPSSIVFLKARKRTKSNFGFRDSYPFPILPWYGWGENIYTLTPPRPDGTLRNITNLENGAVQGLELSYDAKKILFSMRKDFATDGFHVYEMNIDGSGLRQLTFGNCNDVDPCYLPDGRIVFCSDRAGYLEFYHQERSRVLHVMNADGSDIRQISFNPNSDFEPIVLRDGRILYGSYRFYGWDGGPSAVAEDPRKGISRIETVLHAVLPNGTGEQVFYGSMRGGFYATLRPLPYANQYQTTAWPRTNQMVGVSVSFQRELPDGRIICVTPAGLTIVHPAENFMDCETPLFPEILNLAGGEEVYIHHFDDQNPIGRFTAPYPLGGDWVLVSHAPWYDTRLNGNGLYVFNLQTRELRLLYDDPELSDVDALPVVPKPAPMTIAVSDPPRNMDTGFVFCESVFNSDLPFDRARVAYVQVLEGIPVAMSLNGNLGFQTRALGVAPIARDGSFYVEVPADTPFRFALLDAAGNVMVHETEFLYVRPGERRGCIGCHEAKGTTPANKAVEALRHPPYAATRKRGDLVYGGLTSRSYNYVVRQ